MAFPNSGGIKNGGVCWWHSRMQRNALYLTLYKPEEPRPSLTEAKIIIDKLRDGKEVIVIPGFYDFADFSNTHKLSIQRELEKWQKKDGIVKFNWLKGLKGKKSVSPETLKAMMDELYNYVEVQGNIAYQKLQVKGVASHSWLVVNMKKLDEGYDLEVIDSNYNSMTSIYRYRRGMMSFTHDFYGAFVPYLEREKEMSKMANVISSACRQVTYDVKLPEVLVKENEITEEKIIEEETPEIIDIPETQIQTDN